MSWQVLTTKPEQLQRENTNTTQNDKRNYSSRRINVQNTDIRDQRQEKRDRTSCSIIHGPDYPETPQHLAEAVHHLLRVFHLS